MTESPDERYRKLKHDLANPLSAILAETQMLLLGADQLDEEVAGSLKQIEGLCHKMRSMLQAD